MDPLHAFLRFLYERYDNPFLVDGTIHSNDNTIRELGLMDPFYSIKFSLQVTEPNRVIHLIDTWAPKVPAVIKHIYWRDLDSMVSIHYELKLIEVTTPSNNFLTMCEDYANTLQYQVRRI
jgi:hypothetical protein